MLDFGMTDDEYVDIMVRANSRKLQGQINHHEWLESSQSRNATRIVKVLQKSRIDAADSTMLAIKREFELA